MWGCFWSRSSYGPGTIPGKEGKQERMSQSERAQQEPERGWVGGGAALLFVCYCEAGTPQTQVLPRLRWGTWSPYICGWETEAENAVSLRFLWLFFLFNGNALLGPVFKMEVYDYFHLTNLNKKTRFLPLFLHPNQGRVMRVSSCIF